MCPRTVVGGAYSQGFRKRYCGRVVLVNAVTKKTAPLERRGLLFVVFGKVCSLFHQDHFLRIGESPGVKPVEVDTGRKR